MNHIQSQITILSQTEIEQIHAATLNILATTGCRLPHPRVLDLLEARGATVDRATGVAKLPRALVEQALRETRPAPGGDARLPVMRHPYDIHLSNQATIVEYSDPRQPRTNTRRLGNTEDVIKGLVLTNHLPFVGSCMPLVTPSDCPGYMQDLYAYYLCTLYSTKPYGVYICSPESARQILRMWEVVKNEPSRANFPPQVGYLLEPNGALSYDIHSLEMAIIFAEAGHPIWLGPMAMSGLDAPVTLAGTMVMQNAYNLAGIVFCWLFGRPGSWSGSAHTADMRSFLCSFGSPNQVFIALAAIQMGRHYGYEISVNSGLTDACVPDFQSGFEKGMTGMVAFLAGAGGIGAQAIVGADQGVSYEQLVIDNEWASAFHHLFSRGVEVNEETLAVEVIQQVGIGGSFIAEEHTVRHARKTYWKSDLFNQASYDAWMADGGKDVHEKAHEKVEALLAQHYPPQPVISAEKIAALDAILAEARNAPEKFAL
jgi:trimethylamine--corrinoid protein Co-methyltransferase